METEIIKRLKSGAWDKQIAESVLARVELAPKRKVYKVFYPLVACLLLSFVILSLSLQVDLKSEQLMVNDEDYLLSVEIDQFISSEP